MYQFLLWLVPAVDKFPRARKFVLGDRIETAALDMLDAWIIATYTRDRGSLPSDANLGLERLRFFMLLSHKLRLIKNRRYKHPARSIDGAGRLVGGWIKAHHARTA